MAVQSENINSGAHSRITRTYFISHLVIVNYNPTYYTSHDSWSLPVLHRRQGSFTPCFSSYCRRCSEVPVLHWKSYSDWYSSTSPRGSSYPRHLLLFWLPQDASQVSNFEILLFGAFCQVIRLYFWVLSDSSPTPCIPRVQWSQPQHKILTLALAFDIKSTE